MNIHQPLVEGSLWASLLVDCRAIAGAVLPGVGGILALTKVLRLIFWHPDHRPVFRMLALRAWHYADNHYSGAMWLLYVMIPCGA